MRKPKVLVVDDESSLLKLISEILEHIDCEPATLQYVDEIKQISSLKPDLIILDQKINGAGVKPTQKGTEIAKNLQQNHETRDIPRIMLTGISKIQQGEVALETLHSSLFRDIISKSQFYLQPKKHLDFFLEKYITIPLRIGFITLGRLAQKTIEILFKEHPEYVEEIGGVSLTGRHTEEVLRRRLDIGDPRLKFHDNLEEFVESAYDITLISSSNQASSRAEPGRNWLWDIEKQIQYDLFSRIIEIKRRLGEKERDTKSLLVEGTNPIGANIRLGIELGISPERITGLSVADTQRAKEWLRQKYQERFSEYPKNEDVHVRVVGQHGLEIPIVNSTKIMGESIRELKEIHGFEIDRKRFIRELREGGGKVMEAVAMLSILDKYEALYRGVPEAFVKLIGELSKRKQPQESLYSRRKTLTGYMEFNGPTEIIYSDKGLEVRAKPLKDYLTKEELYQIVGESLQEEEFQESNVRDFLKRKS